MGERKQFSKVTIEGHQVFYTRELDRSKLLLLEGVQKVEDAWLTEEEYVSMPASEEARAFFSGKEFSTRPADLPVARPDDEGSTKSAA